MGPLAGLKIVEFAGIGPGPFAAMLLADLGAEIIRIERKEPSELGLQRPRGYDYALRNRKIIQLDLKSAEGVEFAPRLVDQADALLEGFRPRAMERLGLGPDVCLTRNPRLIYGRITGWGQTGRRAASTWRSQANCSRALRRDSAEVNRCHLSRWSWVPVRRYVAC